MNLESILCPIDLTDESASALPIAVSLAGKYGARIYLVHVVDDSFPFPDVFAWRRPGDDFYKAMRNEALDQMERLVTKGGVGDQTIEKVVLQGRPAAEVVAFARDKKVDLIVLSTLGRKGFDQAFVGSQALKILRAAPCPVLSFKPEIAE